MAAGTGTAGAEGKTEAEAAAIADKAADAAEIQETEDPDINTAAVPVDGPVVEPVAVPVGEPVGELVAMPVARRQPRMACYTVEEFDDDPIVCTPKRRVRL